MENKTKKELVLIWIKKGLSFFKKVNYEHAFVRLLGLFFFVSACVLIQNRFIDFKVAFTYKSYSEYVEPGVVLMWIMLLFLVFSALHIFFKKGYFDFYALFISPLILTFACLWSHSNTPLMYGLILLNVFIIVYLMKDDKLGLKKINISDFQVKLFLALFATIFVLYVGTITTYRYLTYSNGTYDFGIFVQMYHYLKERLIPYTTCERNKLLSHFAIHLSPIYYLLLPIYFIFPFASTLQISQAVVIGTGIIPLYLLCRRHDFSNKTILAIGFVYAFAPALITANFYDFHENMFLPPLILWFIYFFEKKNPLLYLFLALLLMVKEDACIYAACICLFMIINKRRYKDGFFCLGSTIIYFFISMLILKHFGEGAMTNRLDNFMTDDSLFSIIRVLFTNPAYFFSESFNTDTIPFLMQMLLPFLFIPLFSRNVSQLILFIPLLLINLMPAYVYQASIYFQYVYGSTTLTIYALILNVKSVPERPTLLLSMICTCAIMCLSLSSFYTDVVNSYDNNRKTIAILNKELAKIDEDKSVIATTCLIPHLANRDILYDYDYNKEYDADYIVLDRRWKENIFSQNSFVNKKVLQGYTITTDIENVILILQK